MILNFTTCLKSIKGQIWKFQEQFFNQIPEKSGVYIIGIKSKSYSDNSEKFYPMYVGETNNLRNRIESHYIGNSAGTMNGNKEIFDLSEGKLDLLYNSINELNLNRPKSQHVKAKVKSSSFPVSCRKCIGERQLFNGGLSSDNTLLWFPNPDFFNFKVSNGWKSVLFFHDMDYMHSYSMLRDLSRSVESGTLNSALLFSKHVIWDKFYFIYAITPKKDTVTAEFYTKQELDQNGLFTLAAPKLKKNPNITFSSNLKQVSISESFKVPIE